MLTNEWETEYRFVGKEEYKHQCNIFNNYYLPVLIIFKIIVGEVGYMSSLMTGAERDLKDHNFISLSFVLLREEREKKYSKKKTKGTEKAKKLLS